jgi:hypothetical protein
LFLNFNMVSALKWTVQRDGFLAGSGSSWYCRSSLNRWGAEIFNWFHPSPPLCEAV